MATPVVAAAAESLDTELIEILGGAAAALAALGMLLLLPIFLNHRREIERLLEWKERDPEAGTTEFRAVPGPVRTGGNEALPTLNSLAGSVPGPPGRYCEPTMAWKLRPSPR